MGVASPFPFSSFLFFRRWTDVHFLDLFFFLLLLLLCRVKRRREICPKGGFLFTGNEGAEKHENNSATPHPSGGGSAPSEDREGPDACIASCSKISPSHSPPLPTYLLFSFLFPPLLLLPRGRVGVQKVRICTSSSTTTSSYKHFCSLRAMEHVYQIDNC